MALLLGRPPGDGAMSRPTDLPISGRTGRPVGQSAGVAAALAESGRPGGGRDLLGAAGLKGWATRGPQGGGSARGARGGPPAAAAAHRGYGEELVNGFKRIVTGRALQLPIPRT